MEQRYSQKVFSLALWGLTVQQGRELFTQTSPHAKEIRGTDQQWQTLINYYDGNPLALKLLSEPLHMFFGGNLGAFLEEKWGVFGDIADLLRQQLERLSALEQQILYWLAVERQALSLEELKADF